MQGEKLTIFRGKGTKSCFIHVIESHISEKFIKFATKNVNCE